jgi:serine/threonine protein phosphatase 1
MEERLFAIGDIHGCINELQLLVESAARIGKKDKVVFLGDYIDRGLNSREVVDYITGMRDSGIDIVTLRGNHEEMLLETYENEERWYNWFLNGGSFTINSFGIKSVKNLPLHYLEFFHGLGYYFQLENFIFVHAGLNDDLEDPFEDKSEMIWTRRETYKNPVLDNFIIIHGHTPVSLDICRAMVKGHEKVINIDTGCVYSGLPGLGHLSAVELRSMSLFSV